MSASPPAGLHPGGTSPPASVSSQHSGDPLLRGALPRESMVPAAGPPPLGPLLLPRPRDTSRGHFRLRAPRLSLLLRSPQASLGWPFTRGRRALPARAARPRRQSQARGPRGTRRIPVPLLGPRNLRFECAPPGHLGFPDFGSSAKSKIQILPPHRRGPLESFPQSLCVQIRAQFLLGNRAIMEYVRDYGMPGKRGAQSDLWKSDTTGAPPCWSRGLRFLWLLETPAHGGGEEDPLVDTVCVLGSQGKPCLRAASPGL